jgi:hypothetical protein
MSAITRIQTSLNEFKDSANIALNKGWTTVLVKALVPTALKVQDFVLWNLKELKNANPIAMLTAPVALVVHWINSLIMPVINKAILSHQDTTPSQKLGALQHALPQAQDVVHPTDRALAADLFGRLSFELRNDLDGAIYHAYQQNPGQANVLISLEDPNFGQHYREQFLIGNIVNQAIANLKNQLDS